MKRIFSIAALLLLSPLVHAANPLEAKAMGIMGKSDCLACHSVDKKIVGPAFKDVAAKYKGKATASDMLVKKVKMGGAGNWGEMAMPAHPNVSDADLKTVVSWILATPAK
jgi:cytochrome c